MASGVRIYEVSLRDGLQNEQRLVSTKDKLAFAERLVSAGFRDIELGSFVSPRWVPQMADTDELFRRLHDVDGADDVNLWALVPNARGLDRALNAGVRCVATFLSASETHNKKNVNRTIRESLAGLQRVIATARSEGQQVRSYISTVFGCPFEGAVDVSRTVDLALALRDAGASKIALGDTTGMAQPGQVRNVIRALSSAGIPLDMVALHFHDTRGTAVVNAYAAWLEGIEDFDGSLGGIGGCPYAPGATGNAATEDLIYLFDAMGAPTGIDLDAACQASVFMEGVLGRVLPGRYLAYGKSQRAVDHAIIKSA